jgi:hypothetical protein
MEKGGRSPSDGAPYPRWFWVLLVIGVASIILSATALSLEITRTQSEQKVVFSGSFVVGSVAPCNNTLILAYCDWINFNLSGGSGVYHLTLAKANFNATCPSDCTVEVGSYPVNNGSGAYSFGVNKAASGGGIISGGPGWIEVWESRNCVAHSGNCGYFPVQAAIELDDIGEVSE